MSAHTQPHQQPTNTYQAALTQQLRKFNLDSIQEMAHIILDADLSQLFKSKYAQTFAPSTQLTQKLKKMSLQHTYNQMYIYYEQLPLQITECRQAFKYKYQQDDILRTHHNRKSIWLLCSGALFKINQNPGFYSKLTQTRSSYPQFYCNTIQKDVVRTIHDKSSQAQQILSSILRNLAMRNPYVGYCQGMNFVVNFLVLMQFSEEEAFWITTELIENWLPKTYYTNMMGVAVDVSIIEHYVKVHYPALHQKLLQLNLSLSLFILEWLVCLFTSTLPFYMLVIVWDMMFIYGPSVLLRVCIVILDQISQIILHTDDICNYGLRQTAELLVKIQDKKKNIFIQEDKFIARIHQVYIDDDLLEVCKNLIQLELMIEKAQHKLSSSKMQKHLTADCDIDWPICFKALKQHKSDLGEIQVWTFRQQNPLKPISDYLTLRTKKSHKPPEDNRPDSKKLLIGRIPHVCDITSYNKKHHHDQCGFELEEFDILNRKMLIQSLLGWGSKLSVDSQQLNFFRSPTNQKLPFVQSETQKFKSIEKTQNSSIQTQEPKKQREHQEKEQKIRLTTLGQKKESHEQAVKQKQPTFQSQPSPQKQEIQQGESEESKKTRNPFKKLRNKWRQRKGRNQE